MKEPLELINISFNKLLKIDEIEKIKTLYINVFVWFNKKIVNCTFVRAYNPHEDEMNWYFKESDFKCDHNNLNSVMNEVCYCSDCNNYIENGNY